MDARARGHKERASTEWAFQGIRQQHHPSLVRSSYIPTSLLTYILATTTTLTSSHLPSLSTAAALTAKLSTSQRIESQCAWRPWHSSTKPQERGSAQESLTKIQYRHTYHLSYLYAITPLRRRRLVRLATISLLRLNKHFPRTLFCAGQHTASGVQDESSPLTHDHFDTPID